MDFREFLRSIEKSLQEAAARATAAAKPLVEAARTARAQRNAALAEETSTAAAQGTAGRVLPLRLPRPDPASKPEDRIAATLGAVLETLRATIRFTSANVFLLENGALVQRAYTTKSKALARLASVRPDQGFFAYVMKNGRPLILNNIRKEGRSLGYYAQPGEKVGSFALVPIRAGNAIAGLLALDDANENAFPAETAEPALLAIAGLLGHVIEAEGRAQEAEEEIRKVRLSRGVAETAASGRTFEEAAEAVARSAREATNAFSAALFLKSEVGELRLAGGIGYHDLFAQNFKMKTALFMAEHALRQGSPFLLEGPSLAARYRGALPGQAPGASFAVPLHYRGEGIGALCLDFTAAKDIPEGVSETLAASASEVAAHLVRIYQAGIDRERAEGTTGDLETALDLLSSTEDRIFWEKYFGLLSTACPGARGFAAYLREGEVFRPVASKDLDVPGDTFAAGTGLVGWSALSGRPARIQRRDRKDIPMSGNSFLTFPIFSSDNDAKNVLAVCLLSYDAKEVPERDAEAAERLSRLGSAALPVVLRIAEADARVSKDTATGLWNRLAFEARAGAVLAHRTATLFYLDCLGTDRIEERLGHLETERLVSRVGRVLARAASAESIVGRVGEREFALLLPTTRARDVAETAKRLEETVVAAHIGAEEPGGFGITLSIGVAQSERAPASYARLYEISEAASRGANVREPLRAAGGSTAAGGTSAAAPLRFSER